MSDRESSVADGDSTKIPMPISIDDIDAAWLTAALADRLPDGVEVRSFSVETIGTGDRPDGSALPAHDRLRRRRSGRGADDGGREAAGTDRRDPPGGRGLPALREGSRVLPQPRGGHPAAHAGGLLRRSRPRDRRLRARDGGCRPPPSGRSDRGLRARRCGRRGRPRSPSITRAFWNDPRFETDELAWLPFGSDAPIPEGVVQALRRVLGAVRGVHRRRSQPRGQGRGGVAARRGARVVERSRRARHDRVARRLPARQPVLRRCREP